MSKINFINTVKDCRVAVLGDFILDEYVWGDTSRISPEAPVPIVKMLGSELRLGGAANVVNNVRTLGAIPIPISVVGNQQGWKLVHALDDLGIPTNQIVLSDTYKNSHKIRIVSGAQQMVRLDNDSEGQIDALSEEQILENLDYSIPSCDALIISDYQKGVLTPRVMKKAICLAKDKGIPIIIDPKGKDYSLYKGATLITPNEAELEYATGITIDRGDPKKLRIAAMILIRKLALEGLVLTQSEDGMSIFLKNGDYFKIGSNALEVYDVTGAGDTVAASIACAMATGESIPEACDIATEAAAVVVSKIGTATCSLEELQLDFPKMKNEAALLTEIEQLKNRGKKIVFTNGCFDLLHSGHVQLLQKSKTYGDILIVGINSDDSVRAIKGPSRPMIDENERAHLLSALNCVDFVTVFNDETPADIINKIKPDVLVKGKDYEGQDVVGSEDSGKVVFIDLKQGQSTSNIIKKIVDTTAKDI